MLFNAATVLGLVAVATAAPHLHSRFQRDVSERSVGQPAARGNTYTPLKRRRQNFGNQVDVFGVSVDISSSVNDLLAQEQIQILQLQQQQLQQEELQQEILLTQAIALQLQEQAEFQLALDNIRINTFNNLNNQVNTVAVVVSQIVDNRDVNNVNNRYLVRQLQSNPSIQETAFVVFQESSVFNINNNIPSSFFSSQSNSSNAVDSLNSFINPSIGFYNPGQTISLQSSGLNLLPAGSQVPNFYNAALINDPALIVLPNQQALVTDASNQQAFQITVTEIQQSSLNSGLGAFDFSSSNAAADQLAAQLLASGL